MDEQGLDRTLMFPTLASLVEERLRDDPDLIHVVVHALNEWIYETWKFDYEGRIFTTPVISCPSSNGPSRSSSGCSSGAPRSSSIRPAPVPGFRGSRSFGLPEFDPVLGEGRRTRRTGGHALVGQWLRAVHQRLAGQRQ